MISASTPDGEPVSSWLRGMVLVLALMLFGMLSRALPALPAESQGLGPEAVEVLGETGLKNPVTAVVLNYRGYDTLLEMAVLFLAVLGTRAVAKTEDSESFSAPGAVPAAALRWLVPLAIFFSGYLLWIGSFAPGGAFQGGAMLSGARVLLLASGTLHPQRIADWIWRCALILGLWGFMAAGVGFMMAGDRFLEYSADSVGVWTLLIEAGCLLSIGVTLAVLFIGGSTATKGER